ncbi:lipopolysaccharide heptosyltransferase I [soil metagenome]
MSADLPPSSLLFIKPGSFGDIIHALPCAAALKLHWPGTRLTWLVDERWQSLLDGNPHLDEIVTFPRQQFRGITGKIRSIPWALQLKRFQPDLALDLQGLIRSALMARLSEAKKIVGLGDAREGASWFYDKVTPVESGEHAVLRYLRTLQTVGVPRPSHLEFTLPLGTPPAKPVSSPFILLHPFARGAGKSLSPDQVIQLSAALRPHHVVIAGQGKIDQPLPDNATSLLNETNIPQLIWLLRAATTVVSVDSGPMHIAAALGANLLSIHTWSDPREVGPFNESAWIWQGGTIRRQHLTPGEALPEPRPVESMDLARIAEWAGGQIKA